MNLEKLLNKDIEIILSCFTASLDKEFFPDWEYSTLIGGEKSEIQNLLENPNNINWQDEMIQIWLNNIIVNLLWYPHQASQKKWEEYFKLSPKELLEFLEKLNWEKIENYTQWIK